QLKDLGSRVWSRGCRGRSSVQGPESLGLVQEEQPSEANQMLSEGEQDFLFSSFFLARSADRPGHAEQVADGLLVWVCDSDGIAIMPCTKEKGCALCRVDPPGGTMHGSHRGMGCIWSTATRLGTAGDFSSLPEESLAVGKRLVVLSLAVPFVGELRVPRDGGSLVHRRASHCRSAAPAAERFSSNLFINKKTARVSGDCRVDSSVLVVSATEKCPLSGKEMQPGFIVLRLHQHSTRRRGTLEAQMDNGQGVGGWSGRLGVVSDPGARGVGGSFLPCGNAPEANHLMEATLTSPHARPSLPRPSQFQGPPEW
ncbi:uncharacterized protein EI97DRAFT_482852, partial [Westerdykella ornata]